MNGTISPKNNISTTVQPHNNNTGLQQRDHHADSQQHPYTDLDLILMASYALVFVVGIAGNILVCMMFKMSNGKLKVMEHMIVCLAITDLFASIINPALYTYWQVTRNEVWHFGLIGCKLTPVINRSITNVSFGLIMMINIDRCIVITRPFRPKMRKKDVHIALVGIIFLAIALEIPFIYHIEVIADKICLVPDSRVASFAIPAIAIMVTKGLLFLITFITTVVCIYKELYDSEMMRSLQNQKRTEHNKTVLIMLATIAVVFIILVFPRDVLHIIYIISWLDNDGIPFTHLLRNINATFKILHMCNSICNVFVYAGLHRRFRRDVKRKVSSAILARNNAKRTGGGGGMGRGGLKVIYTQDGPRVVEAPPTDDDYFHYHEIESWEWDESSTSTV